MRSQLIYRVSYVHSGRGERWIVRCEGECYGPFASCPDAVSRAREEAAAAESFGFASRVCIPVTAEEFFTMVDDNITDALRAVESGLVRHVHPFTWDRADGAEHVAPRTLQRALQQELIVVEKNLDRTSQPVGLTRAGQARLGRDAPWWPGARR